MPDRFFTRPIYLQLRDTLAERMRSGGGNPAAASNEVDLVGSMVSAKGPCAERWSYLKASG
jgi:hypothetical protein